MSAMPDPTADIKAFGGFIHPVERPLPGGGTYSSGGMTLRDWFAGQALAGLMARRDWAICARTETYALESYRVADAMLAERAKP